VRAVRSQIVSTGFVVFLSLAAAVAVTWLIPSLTAASVNMLFRFRGRVAPPEDIVIVAIDDASLQEVGSWPWPRSVMASVLDRISAAHPRAIGLDVVYAEPSAPAQDDLLTESIRRNGRVVLPAQLTEAETTPDEAGGPSQWLLPLPGMKTAAAATGHAHADPDVDGVLRTVQLSKADDRGERLWAFGLETLRVAEGLPPGAVKEEERELRVGRYRIAVHNETEKSDIPGVTLVRPDEMIINYLGPPRTFPYYSIADVLRGGVPASSFENKIVLVGAVAQTLGDTRVTPYISYADGVRQGGVGMPGVEVHANVIETMRRGVWLTPRTDLAGFGVTLLVIICATLCVRALDGWRVVSGLGLLLVLIVGGSLYVFDHNFVMPPLVPMTVGFFTVGPLLLLQGSLAASRDLDRKLVRLAGIQKRFIPRGQSGGSDATGDNASAGLPHNVAWKLRAVDEITELLVARVGFMNQVFTSMTDGLLVADTAGRIIFANPAAQRFRGGAGHEALTGRSLEELFGDGEVIDRDTLGEMVRGALDGRVTSVEVELSGREDRFYVLQFSAVLAGEADEPESRGGVSQAPGANTLGPAGLIVIITDVTKRRELERIQAETLQLVSHELRTPLTSIRALSDVLLKFSVPEDESRESLKTIYSESVRMSDLINLYLDITRVETGAQVLSRAPVSANDLIVECVRAFGRAAAEKGIRLRTKLEEPAPTLSADRQLLTQALGNLLGNAVKYSPSGSEVEVVSSSDGTHARIHVRDRGYGIPREFHERVFEKFYRLERDVRAEVVGTGLGLSLVREIVERHGGRVILESEPDAGSTFTIYLPLQKAD
jgi:signal transduction histidine kinase/CHASE2 domain-containing sensor protein